MKGISTKFVACNIYAWELEIIGNALKGARKYFLSGIGS